MRMHSGFRILYYTSHAFYYKIDKSFEKAAINNFKAGVN